MKVGEIWQSKDNILKVEILGLHKETYIIPEGVHECVKYIFIEITYSAEDLISPDASALVRVGQIDSMPITDFLRCFKKVYELEENL